MKKNGIRMSTLLICSILAIVLLVLLLLIALMIWALISFGSYLYSVIASI